MATKFWIAAEHTTTWSRETGLCPNRDCGHHHKTYETAERCAAKPYPWKVYATLDDDRVVEPHSALTI